MTHWYLGTCGFSHGDWLRSFYPSRVPAAGRLGWYARQFNAVELDTAKGLPRPHQVAHWASAVPSGFRFAVLAPQSITQQPGRLDGAPRLRQLQRLAECLAPLGKSLGVVLLRLPAEVRHARFGELQVLLEAAADTGLRWAVEFQHADWWQTQTAELLTELNMAWADVDQPDRSLATQPVDRVAESVYRPRLAPRTADFLYVRWLGRGGQFADLGREQLDPEPRLRWWLQYLRERLAEHPAPGGVFGFFGNGYAGHGPATCRRLRNLLRGEAPPRVPLDQPPLL